MMNAQSRKRSLGEKSSRGNAIARAVVPAIETLEKRQMLSVTLNNGLATSSPDYFAVTVEDAGATGTEIGSGGGTTFGGTSTIYQYNGIFDDGEGGTFELNEFTSGDPVKQSDGSVLSSGSITPTDGGTVSFTVRSSLPSGTLGFIDQYSFTASGGYDLTKGRLFQYMDSDISSSTSDLQDNVLTVSGTTAGTGNDRLVLTTIDPESNIRQAQEDGESGTNSKLAGFAADEYDELEGNIESGGFSAPAAGNIETEDLPPETVPNVGPAYGPNDITSALAYTFSSSTSATLSTILGSSTIIPGQPKIDIVGNSQLILNGDTAPTTADNTNFGSVAEGSTQVNTFTVDNDGTAGLTLTGSPEVKLSGADAGDFTVTTEPAGSIAANASSGFDIQFKPSALGLRTATVTIASNDTTGPSYTFTIEGTGTQSVTPVTSIVVTPASNQTATAGVAKSFTLGSFVEANATAPYTVVVKWGDGSANTTIDENAAGTIPATSHTYASAGSDTVSVTVTDSASHVSNTGTFVAAVTAATVTTITAVPPSNQTATTGISKSFTLGSFTEANATGPYTVDVKWGDGSTDTKFNTSSAGTIAAQAHSYAAAGNDTVSITVTDADGHTSNTATFVAAVTAPAATSIVVTPPSNQTGTVGVAKSFALGSFAETNATGPYTVDIKWGDGTADTTFNASSVGTIAAKSHTYAAAGSDTVSITVTDSAGHTSNTGTFIAAISTAVVTTGSISGLTLLDDCGNGIIADATPLAAVTVKAYADTNGDGTLDTGDTLVSTITTGSTGAYSFSNLPAGKYFVAETVPTGYVRITPATTGDYTVSLTANDTVTGDDFLDFKRVTDTGLSNVSYQIGGHTFSTLRGNTANGDTISVTFTVTNPSGEKVSLVSYSAPDATFNAADANQQQAFQDVSNTYAPGTYTISVKTPPTGHYQVDFVVGCEIQQFGPVGSNIFYTQQGRLISADNE